MNVNVYPFSVAPMMDWTTRHQRVFMRQITKKALLYTEMITPNAIIFGDKKQLLGFDPIEQPLAIQLGGSDKELLLKASMIAYDWGYRHINLNVGCPSDRVQNGNFGACLMKNPLLVASCAAYLIEHLPLDSVISIKCRLGVDDQDPRGTLPIFMQHIHNAGVRHVIIHARKAILEGLSPKENRQIPPLDYDLVGTMKQQFSDTHIVLNGGLTNVQDAFITMRSLGLDGVMVGRSIYHKPYDFIDIDSVFYDRDTHVPRETNGGIDSLATHSSNINPRETIWRDIEQRQKIMMFMIDYAARKALEDQTPLNAITRHTLGLFDGVPLGRKFRRIVSELSHHNNHVLLRENLENFFHEQYERWQHFQQESE